MNIQTAVVTAAGAASRMWPSSKAIPKELFPLGRIPAIMHLVWEFRDAGIRRVIFVVSERSEAPLRALLRKDQEPPANVRDLPEVVRFQESLAAMEFAFIHQVGPYGNGTPMRNALDLTPGETVIYAFGDDIVIGENTSRGLLDLHRRTGWPALSAQCVEPERVRQFGIVEATLVDGHPAIGRLVEKPAPGVTDSRLAVFGRYVLTPDVGRKLLDTPVGRGGELWLTDALLAYLGEGHPIGVFTLTTGRWVTVGDPRSYAEAVRLAVAEQR